MNPVISSLEAPGSASTPARGWGAKSLLLSPSILIGLLFLALLVGASLLAPWIGTVDPGTISPGLRNKPPGTIIPIGSANGDASHVALLGTDGLGRDVFSRIVYGARVSMLVGLSAALFSVALGLIIGLVAGYFRRVDGVLMRGMDGLMAIPGVLLAIALVSLLDAGVTSVIVAIVVPEVPRVVRLVRSYVLGIREEPYVEAAIMAGTPTVLLLVRHMVPNLVSPLIVQGTFICASAILVEAYLSFLGIGIPPEIPTWGNVMAEGRAVFRLHPHMIFAAGTVLAFTILSLNMVGDAMRDLLDPKLAKRA